MKVERKQCIQIKKLDTIYTIIKVSSGFILIIENTYGDVEEIEAFEKLVDLEDEIELSINEELLT